MARHKLAIDRCEQIRVFNRSCNVLTVQCDGIQWDLQPGWGLPPKGNLIPTVVVQYALRQHPRLGTFGQGGGGGESLIAVEGYSPEDHFQLLEPGQEHLGREWIDRKTHPLPPDRRIEDLPPQRNFAADFGNPLDKGGDVVFTNDLPEAGIAPPDFMQPWREPS